MYESHFIAQNLYKLLRHIKQDVLSVISVFKLAGAAGQNVSWMLFLMQFDTCGVEWSNEYSRILVYVIWISVNKPAPEPLQKKRSQKYPSEQVNEATIEDSVLRFLFVVASNYLLIDQMNN